MQWDCSESEMALSVAGVKVACSVIGAPSRWLAGNGGHLRASDQEQTGTKRLLTKAVSVQLSSITLGKS